jgi:hydrogenase maturation protease
VPESWKSALGARLAEPVAVVGVGNSVCGDDGAGPEVVRLLRGRTRAALFDCQTAPENFTGPIARAGPRCILLVDAAPTGARPGAVGLFETERLHETSFHTHAASPALFLGLLVERTGADGFLIGIQPKASGLGAVMSDEVAAAAREVADAIAQLLPIGKSEAETRDSKSEVRTKGAPVGASGC